MQRLGIGTASFGLAVSVLFPSAAFANSPLQSSSELTSQVTEALTQQVVPQNYAGVSTDSSPVTVIVELTNTPVNVYEREVKISGQRSSISQRSRIHSEHNSFTAAAKRIGATPGTEYSNIFNGYSVTLPGNQVDKLLKLPGVTAIYPNNEVHALADSTEAAAPVTRSYSDSGELIGADKLHDEGYTGKGVKVAVVDTGIDYNHPLLKDNFKGGYDAVDKDEDPYETAPDSNFPDKPNRPYATSHGTHVSGTVLDIAPEADLYVYRVLGPYGSGTTEDVIAGIEKAVEDQVDVINLSLGSDMNQSYSADSIAIDNTVKSGVDVVVAAGNAGPDEATLGSPAGAQLALTVGASTVPVTTPFFDIGNLKKIPGLIATYSPELTEDISGYPVIYAGIGTPADFANVDAKDKVVLVDRGQINFVAKAVNAKAAGAKVLLIANNTSGELGATLGAPGDYPPTFGITQANGTAVKAELAAGRTSISYVPVTEKNQLADFSSTGPGYPDYLLKPDVVAPGVSINSTVPLWESEDDSYNTAFGLKQGTSMATPHVVGAVALLVGKYPNLSPEQIKTLLMNNADPIKDRNGDLYSLYQQGAGLINLVKSINSDSIAKVGEIFNSGLPGSVDIPYYTGSFSFGLQPKGATVTKAVYVEQFNNQPAKEYDVSLDWLNNEPADITISPESNKITSGSGVGNYIPIKLSVDDNAVDGAYEAILNLKSGDELLRLPLNVLVGDKFNLEPVNQLGLDDTEISPNGDGRFDKTGFYFSVNQDLPNIRFVATSVDDPSTVIGDVYSSQETVYRGAHEFLDWGGTVTDPSTSAVSVLPDGHYLITPILPGDIWAREQAVVFTVDTAKPVSSGYALEEYERESPTDDRYAFISGFIDEDLLADLISQSRPVSSLFSVYAVGKDFDGTEKAFAGTIAADGYFEIDVPVNEGVNDYLVFVTDSAGNGQDEDDYSQHLIYNTADGGIKVAPQASAKSIEVGQSVTIDVYFSATDAVYGVNGAALGLIYSNTLDTPVIQTSVQLATYQEQKFPGVSLAELTDTGVFGEASKLTQYAVQLSEGAAYTGKGSLAQFTFTPKKAGTYSFELHGVQIWNDDVTTTIPSSISSVTVTVADPVTPVDPGTGSPGTPSSPGSAPSSTATPTTGIGTVASGQLTVTADPAGGKPTASLAVSDSILDAALKSAVNNNVVLSITDVDFSKYGQVSIVLTSAQADKMKSSASALSLNGKGFSLTIPAGTLPDFITASGLTVTLGLHEEADTAPLSGSTGSIDIGSSSLTLKNGWTTSKPVFVQLALNPDGLKDVRKTGAYKESAENSWSYLQPGTIPADGLLQFSITGDGTYTAAARNTSFSDIGTHWAKDAVEVLAAHGIVAGKGTTASFKPADSLNQAELLTLFDRLLGKGDTWTTHIKESGSRDVLTREEAAVILAEALGADVTSSALTFKDTGSISANAKNAIAYAVSKGYLQGVGNNTFNPKGTLTRAQAAVILERVLEDLRKQ
ncbi:S8 family serine peptidase [Paenibacillus sp. FSL R10-2199]|uniref:S8 family serine peptidase n=1 Tax=Paenibacillus sp. FSL R10-2199 TaxID=2975348 RepID=UPI0030FC3BF9